MDVECFDCHGKGTRAAFVDAEMGGWFDPAIKCSMCGGTGKITGQKSEWHQIGRRFYEARVARAESVRECANRLGIRPAELSAMEHGRSDPSSLQGLS